MTKKEKARLEAEQAELLKVEMEKEKMRKVEEEKERKARERAEAEKRKKQEVTENRMRRIQLKESSIYFNDINDKIQAIYEERKLQKEWDRYMRCNGLPNSQSPSDLRRYIHIWRKRIEEYNLKERNWILNIDETSILNQNPLILNLTMQHLRSQLPNLGDIYSNQIKEVLGILNEIEESISDTEPIKKSIILDLIQLKTDFRLILDMHIDEFSFKILCNITRDMELQTPVNAVHNYESDVFKSQLWTIRDIPQPPLNPKEKQREETRSTEVNFPSLGLNLMLPPSIKCKQSALRAVWLSYDNFSDYCPSYNAPYKKKPIKDLRTTTRNEWKKRWEILQTTLEEPTEEEEEEEEVDPYEEEEQSPKIRIIDVDKIYLEYEDAINAEYRKNKGPEALKLTDFEINLRKYRIVGGIYCIDYLEQPQQDSKISKKTFLRTLHYPHQLTRKPYYQAFIPPPAPLPGVRRLPEEIEAEMKYMEKNLERLSLATIQLSDNVLWFEPPVVCRWESTEETEISIVEVAKFAKQAYQELLITREEEDEAAKKASEQNKEDGAEEEEENDEISELNPKTEDSAAAAKSTSEIIESKKISINEIPITKIQKRKLMKRKIKKIKDFNLFDIPSDVDMFSLMTHFIVPRLPEGYGIKIETDGKERKGSILRYIKDDSEIPHPADLLNLLKNSSLKSKDIVPSRNNFLEETGSPRLYFPYIKKYKRFKIIPLESSDESSTDEDICTAPASDITKIQPHLHRGGNIKTYLFSKFIKDLEELVEMQIPKFKIKFDEIEENLSPPSKSPDRRDDERRQSQMSLMKDDEYLLRDPYFFSKGNMDELEEEEEEDDYMDSMNSTECDDEEEEIDASDDDEKDYNPPIGRWSTRDVHDAKFNEDKLTIQFRTGRLGFFGLATNRYSNLPYQTWEIKPDIKNPENVIFSLTASVISMEITITSDGVRINSMQGGPLTPIQAIIGVTMPLQNLIKTLQTKAIDVFPEDDAFCYSEGHCEKNSAMEQHLYECMGALGLTHNFSWSRWNQISGSRTCVVLIREIIENKKIPHQSTLYVTPLKACIIDCTEVSVCFNTVGIAGMEYYADLHHLASQHSQNVSKIKQANMCPVLRDNVVQILKATRPLSFC